MTTESFPKTHFIDEGQSGPDDGGYAAAMESGDPGKVQAAMDAVRNAGGLRELASRPFERDDIQQSEIIRPNSEEAKTETNDTGKEVKINNPKIGELNDTSATVEESVEETDESGEKTEMIGAGLELSEEEEDILAGEPSIVSEAAHRVASAKSFSEIEDELDELQAHINQISDPNLAKKLNNYIISLSEASA